MRLGYEAHAAGSVIWRRRREGTVGFGSGVDDVRRNRGWNASAKNRKLEEGLIVGLSFGQLGCLVEALLLTQAPKADERAFDDEFKFNLVAWTAT
jgi:hypothetical protein